MDLERRRKDEPGMRQVVTHARKLMDEMRVIDCSEPSTNWLRFANAGMLHRGNLWCIDYAMGHLPSRAPILEIGSFCGLSTNLLTYYKTRRKRDNVIVTCDTWAFEGADAGRLDGHPSITHPEYRAFVRESFLRNIRMFSRDDPPYTIEMSSDDLFAAWRASRRVTDVLGRSISLGGPLSFCYIDGAHAYDVVKRDVEHCHEFLDRGGFLFLDDSGVGRGFPDVHRVAEELRRRSGYELVRRNPHYLLRKA